MAGWKQSTINDKVASDDRSPEPSTPCPQSFLKMPQIFLVMGKFTSIGALNHKCACYIQGNMP